MVIIVIRYLIYIYVCVCMRIFFLGEEIREINIFVKEDSVKRWKGGEQVRARMQLSKDSDGG